MFPFGIVFVIVDMLHRDLLVMVMVISHVRVRYLLSNTLLLANLGSDRGLGVKEVHDNLAECFELGANQWFGHVIGDHIVCWAVFYLAMLSLRLIRSVI